jgi:HK97 family phage portal protein
MAISLFKSRWFTRGAGDRKPSDDPTKAIASRLASWGNGVFAIKSKELNLTAREMLKNSAVFRCANKIALAVQSVNWYAEAEKGSGVSEKAVTDYDTILKSPNDQMTGSQLRYWMAFNASLFGKVSLKQGVSNGNPSGLYPLQGDNLDAVKNSYGSIIGYKYGDPLSPIYIDSFISAEKQGDTGYPLDGFAFDIMRPSLNLLNNNGNSPLPSIMKQTGILNLLADRALDTADGSPNVKYIITLPSGISTDEEEKVRQSIKDHDVGKEESGGIMVIYGVEIGVHKIENNLSDLHTKIPSDDLTRQIIGAFEIPIALIGIAAGDSAKFSNNYAEARKSFYEDTIIPGYLSPFEESLTRYAPKGIRVRFDIDSIPALQQSRAEMAKELEGVSFLTQNEKREITGWPKLPDGDQVQSDGQGN